ncbi:MAG TPA: hypothetical protein VGR15_03410 [Bacteroidota bacterium]|jgi:hypothetical protein|nr:hypothetical protein [Bacteroidota bacterium]
MEKYNLKMNSSDTDAPAIPVSRFPVYGFVGVVVIGLSEIMLFLGVKIVGVWFTPLAWTGYILFVDALNVRVRGGSLIRSRPREFLAMLPWSVCCWLIFEGYNFYLRNWEYVGLPENEFWRAFGYAWSFATIFPAILETAELFEALQSRYNGKSVSIGSGIVYGMILAGVACLVVPLLVRQEIASTLFGFVWIGAYLLLDPVNYRIGGNSVLGELRRGSRSRLYALALSGIVCGILWEFWNYWAIAKWKYVVPIPFAGPKIFEMPLLGFLGFIPFAFECYAMQEMLIGVFPGLRRGNSN